MKVFRKWHVLAWCLAALACPAHASLIGDEVTCSFEAFSEIGRARGPCSNPLDDLVPGLAIVNDAGPSNPEFFAGLQGFGGMTVDIGADSIELIPEGIILSIPGDIFLYLGSLDWVGSPDGVISDVIATATSFDTGTLTVTHGTDWVTIAMEDVSLNRDSHFFFDLVTDHAPPNPEPMPIPGTPLLMITALVVAVRRTLRCGFAD